MTIEKEKISPAQMIVDLFELRNSYMLPRTEKYERIEHDFQYHSLSVAISCLMEKYKVRSYEIEEEIAERRHHDNVKVGIDDALGFRFRSDDGGVCFGFNRTKERLSFED